MAIDKQQKIYLALAAGLLSIIPCSAIFAFGEAVYTLPFCSPFLILQIPIIFGALAVYIGFSSIRSKKMTALSALSMMLGFAGIAMHLLYSVYVVPVIILLFS